MIPLITSIPPHISRHSPDSREIGTEYARQCIHSWRDSGFEPVTFNAECESVSDLIKEEGVRLITVQRDASETFGKPLVYLRDLVTAAHSLTDGPVAITNADILLDMRDDTRRIVAGIEPGQCLIARRLDIREPASRAGSEFTHGYDFLAFHARDITAFSNDDFIIGLPWWDHYLPLHLFLNGLRSLPVHQHFVFHLQHEDRWEFDTWITLGKRFLHSVRRELNGACARGTPAFDYGRRLTQAELGHDGSLFSRLKNRLNLPKNHNARDLDIQMLNRVAALNVAWLDEQRSLR
jgi:hypothetical protein